MLPNRGNYYLAITRLQVVSIRHLISFMYSTIQCVFTLKKFSDFKYGKLVTQRHLVFWTLSVWKNPTGMRAFSMSKAHKNAINKNSRLAKSSRSCIVSMDQTHSVSDYEVIFKNFIDNNKSHLDDILNEPEIEQLNKQNILATIKIKGRKNDTPR